jgi:hypothetical protein
LIGGGNYLHAATHHSYIYKSLTRNLAKSLHNTEQGSIIIGDADLDLEEEFLNHDDLKNAGSNKVYFHKNSLLARVYFAYSRLHILNYYAQRFKNFPPFCGHSNPIYISQRALLI